MTTTPPLADLHRHLDGSLRPSTLAEFAARAGVAVPADLAFSPGMGLDAALSRFAFTLSLLQTPEAVRRVAAEMCEDAAAEGVTTLEIRFAPQLHRGAPSPWGRERPHTPAEAILDAAVEGAAGRAGIVICGLYGEDPAVLLALVEASASRPGVVGIDLAGGPAEGHQWKLLDYAPAFCRAMDLGLGRTVHAAEGRPAVEIRLAVEALGATRIGHGTTLLEDETALDLVFSRGVVIEACPSSNVHTGVIARLEDHPLPQWIDEGVRVCVCADNTLLSATTAREELERVMRIPGMNEAKRAAVIKTGHQAAFKRS